MAISQQQFLKILSSLHINRASGVPCSILAPIFDAVYSSDVIGYIPAANEGLALAAMVGAQLGGNRGAALMQDSGFGNIINPLTSLCLAYRISPVIVVGYHDATEDEAQHRQMASLMPDITASLGIPLVEFTEKTTEVDEIINKISFYNEQSFPIVLGFRRGSVRSAPKTMSGNITHVAERIKRDEAVDCICRILPQDCAIISTTGHISRSAYYQNTDHPAFYMVGSMGHASAIALGLSVSNDAPSRIAILDGDGALLMHLGVLSTIGAQSPKSMIHIVFDNGTYDSTGGQASTSPNTNFLLVAQGCGYRHVLSCGSLLEAKGALEFSIKADGPILILLKTESSPENEPASILSETTLPDIAAKFSRKLGEVLQNPTLNI